MKSYYQTAYALGCDIGLCIVNDEKEIADKLFDNMWKQIEMFEARFSRFLPDSELTIFNLNAGEYQSISDDMKEMLCLANKYNESTSGIFNVFILPSLQNAGYVNPFDARKDHGKVVDFSTRKFKSADKIIVKDNTAMIPKDTAIDLGGIAKGYLADKLSKYIEDRVHGYWFSIGGDIIAGGKNEHGDSWNIDIASIDPEKQNSINLDLEKFAVATSGILKRRGTKNNTNWHHIIDPRTGAPSNQDILQSTIISTTAVDADILATCTIIAGNNATKSLLANHAVIDCLTQTVSSSGKPTFMQFGDKIKISNANPIASKEHAHA